MHPTRAPGRGQKRKLPLGPAALHDSARNVGSRPKGNTANRTCAALPPPPPRRLTQAAFTPKAIRGYLPRMQTVAEEAVAKWSAEGDVL
jgi:hypothetical protein